MALPCKEQHESALDVCWLIFSINGKSDCLSTYMSAALYLHSGTETKLVVDTSRGQRLRANVSKPLFFLKDPISDASMDEFGDYF